MPPCAESQPKRGRPSKLSEEEWDTVCIRLANGESTSAVARELGLAKSTVSERVSAQVKAIKLAAIELLRAEFSEQILDLSPSEQAELTAMHERLIAYSCAVFRRRHGRRQGRHGEPW